MKLMDEQIRELCERATPGPYTYAKHDAANCKGYVIGGADGTWAGMLLLEMTEDDVRFLTASIELVPQLLERAQKAEAELSQYVRNVEHQHEQLSKLAASRDEWRIRASDAHIRACVLQERLDLLLEKVSSYNDACPERGKGPCPEAEATYDEKVKACTQCWRQVWELVLEQEVQP